jgi:hypothetical protein
MVPLTISKITFTDSLLLLMLVQAGRSKKAGNNRGMSRFIKHGLQIL